MNNKFDDYIKQVNKYDLHEHITQHKFINEHTGTEIHLYKRTCATIR